MSTRRPSNGASLWLIGGDRMASNPELPATPPYYQQNYQIPFSRPRLRWTRELHEQFLNAVNELGGANNATPKKIWDLMQVEGVTICHIKSHLQKYRLGKIGRRFLTRDIVPADGQRDMEDELPENDPMDMEGYPGSSDAFDMKGDEAYKAQNNGNHNHPFGSQTSEMTENPPSLTSVNFEKGTENPPHLPLFPSNGDHLHSFPEWSELLDEDDMKPIVPHLNSLGYPSELPFTRTCNLSKSSTIFGSFFDEVEKFPKIEDDHMMDDNFYPYHGI